MKMPGRWRAKHDPGIIVCALTCVWLLAVGACQPLPRPFAHDVPPDAPILKLPDRGGVVVRPPISSVGPAPSGLVPAIVTALAEREVVATTDVAGNEDSFFLETEIFPRLIIWTLSDRQDTRIGRYASPHAAEDFIGLDTNGGNKSAYLARELARVADDIAHAIQRDEPAPTHTSVHVATVEGAPGTGNQELTAAMRFALRTDPRLALVAASDVALTVRGAVDVGAPQDGAQFVAIRWRIYDPEGAEIGSIDQGNHVPAGSLEAGWGQIALEIALAASVGLGELLAQARIP